jgi:hypothetical protein
VFNDGFIGLDFGAAAQSVIRWRSSSGYRRAVYIERRVVY